MSEVKKFLDQDGVSHLWSKVIEQDYTNSQMLMAVIDAIDESKADKTEIPSTTDFATKTYVDNAIAAIPGVEASETVPSHWKSHLDLKIATINTINGASGYDGINFMFMTDTHWGVGNSNNVIKLVNYIAKNTSTKKVFFGGDMVHCDGKSSDVITYARNLRESFSDNVEVYPIRGNHDTTSSAFGATQWFDVFHRDYTEANKMYYLKDDKVHKVRYIFLDCIAPEASSVSADYQAQLKWMQDNITVLNAGWNVIIVTHSIWASGANVTTCGRALMNAVDAIYDNAACNIIGIFSGHNHADVLQKAAKGYIMMGTEAANLSYNGGSANTATEHAFDVININLSTHTMKSTRIGIGNDRSMTYNIKTGSVVPDTPVNPDGDGSTTDPTEYEKVDVTSLFVLNDTIGIVDCTSGVIRTNDENWECSDFIDVSAYAKLETSVTGSGNTSTYVGCAFYDENKNYISGESNYYSDIGYGHGTVLIDVPANAKYYRFTWMRPNYTKYYQEEWETLRKHIAWLKPGANTPEVPETPTPEIPEDGNLTSLFSWTSNGAIESHTGKQSSAADWRYSNYVNIAGCDSIDMMMIRTTAGSTTKGMAFYDANKQYISGVANNGGGSMTPELRTIEVPVNAVYLRTSWCDDDNSMFKPGESELEFFYCVATGTPAPDIGKDEEEPDIPVNPDVPVVPGEAVDLTSQIVLDQTGYVRANDGGIATDSNWLHNNYFDVSPYAEIEFTYTGTGNSSSQVGCAFYDANKKLIQGIKYYDPEVLYNLGTKKLTVPTGAKYFRMTWMTANHSAYYKPEWEEQHSFIGYLKEEYVVPEGLTDIAERFSFADAGGIEWANGNVSNNTNYYASGYVDVEGFDIIQLAMPAVNNQTTALGMAFYDANQNYITGQANAYDGNWSIATSTISVPDNAKYLRTTWYKENHPNYEEGFSVEAGFKCLAD